MMIFTNLEMIAIGHTLLQTIVYINVPSDLQRTMRTFISIQKAKFKGLILYICDKVGLLSRIF
jgi:hypothetical protein